MNFSEKTVWKNELLSVHCLVPIMLNLPYRFIAVEKFQSDNEIETENFFKFARKYARKKM